MDTRTPPPRPSRDADIDALRGELRGIPSEEARERALALLDRVELHIARLQAVIRDQPEPIFRFHAGGRITFVNPACCDYWRCERVDLLGRPVGRLLPPEGWDALRRVSQRLSLEQPSTTLELRAKGPSGAPRWHRWSIRLVVAEAGGEVGPGQLGRVEFQVLATDISEVKEQHQLLAQHIAERRRLEGVHRQLLLELEERLAGREDELANLRRLLGAEVDTDEVDRGGAPRRRG